MLETAITILLAVLGLYSLAGVVFALLFAFRWVGRIDPAAQEGSWGFRLLIIPGSAALWPLLLSRLRRGSDRPPEPEDAHRRAAGGGAP